MKFWKIFVPLFMLISLTISFFQPVIEASESVSNKVLRLHILANSDSAYDQNAKLMLRDHFLQESRDIFSANNLKENIEIAKYNIENLTSDCNEFLKSIEYDFSVKIEIVKEYFKTRVYDDFTLPAGIYNSIKITIGKGMGHNWWCIVFPAVCISAASTTMDEYLTKEELDVIEGGYTVKFKVVEIYENIKQKIKEQ